MSQQCTGVWLYYDQSWQGAHSFVTEGKWACVSDVISIVELQRTIHNIACFLCTVKPPLVPFASHKPCDQSL